MDRKYSSRTYDVAGSSQKIAQIITEQANYLVNFAVMKDHGITGITLTMKNHYGSCNSPGNIHGSRGQNYGPALMQVIDDILPYKQNLYIIDALKCVYSGGPHNAPQFAEYAYLLSTDPVAIDAVGKQIIDRERDNNGMRETNAPMVERAAESPYNLGVANLSNIDIVEIDPGDSVSILEKHPQSGVQLLPISPNPFVEYCSIILFANEKMKASVSIFDVSGRKVKTISDQILHKGSNPYIWNGRDDNDSRVAPGNYFIKVENGQGTVAKTKIVML
jgi:ureidoglycolate hydrolase